MKRAERVMAQKKVIVMFSTFFPSSLQQLYFECVVRALRKARLVEFMFFFYSF